VALELGVGFVAVRKEAGLLPGPKITITADEDYRGERHVLRIQRASVAAGDRVLLADDWAERGAQALAIRDLVERCGATFVGASLIVDQLDDGVRASLGQVTTIVSRKELPPA